MNIIIRPAEEKDYPAILELNEADVEMLSPIDEEILRRMSQLTALFQVVEIEGTIAAFQMVYREGSSYWSDNYKWFCNKYPCFLYVDRIVVGSEYRKYGIGRRLYEEVISYARKTGVPLVTAEIDIAPKYNTASMAFHKSMGFREVGTKPYKDKEQSERRLQKLIDTAREGVMYGEWNDYGQLL